MKENRRLPESELDIMLVVWNAGGGVSAPAILEGLERPLTASALHSYLKRLEEKGFLACEKRGWNNFYTPLVRQSDYRQREGRTLLEKLYGNSVTGLVASLVEGQAVSEQDLRELREMLEHWGGTP